MRDPQDPGGQLDFKFCLKLTGAPEAALCTNQESRSEREREQSRMNKIHIYEINIYFTMLTSG